MNLLDFILRLTFLMKLFEQSDMEQSNEILSEFIWL